MVSLEFMEEGERRNGWRRDAAAGLSSSRNSWGCPVQQQPFTDEARVPKVDGANLYDPLDDVPWSVRRRLAGETCVAGQVETCPQPFALLEGQADSPGRPAGRTGETRARETKHAEKERLQERRRQREPNKEFKGAADDAETATREELGETAGKSEEKEPSNEGQRQCGQVNGTQGAQNRDETASQDGQREVTGRGREREQHMRRRNPARRMHNGIYDIRSRESRGRSRNRKAESREARSRQAGDGKREVQVMTWNVGGLPKDRITEMVELLPALGLGGVEILAMQEVSCAPGLTEVWAGKGKERWHVVAGKRPTEWRGRMIAVRESLGKVLHKELADDALGVVVKAAGEKLGILNVHLPPKATLSDTGRRTAEWGGMRSMKQPGKMVLGDLNETLVRARVSREEWSTLQHKTARGAMLLQWLSEQGMQAPSQEMSTPAYHPYNLLHQPRRLDYVFFAEIQAGKPGKVHQLRHLASSDHDAVTASMTVTMERQRTPRHRPPAQHGARQLKAEEIVQQTLTRSKTWKGDRLRDLQTVARQITETRKNPFRYVESKEIRAMRAEAMRLRDTPEARALWKQVWRRKKQHKDQWNRELLQEVLRNNWHALQAVKRSKKPTMWISNLTAEEGWQKRMRTHFESIFRKQDGEQVKQAVQVIWKRLERRCKDTQWEPFTPEELAAAMGTWKGGKSTGPDGVSFEALKALYQDTQWHSAILQELNDAFYKGRLLPDLKESITVLAPSNGAKPDRLPCLLAS